MAEPASELQNEIEKLERKHAENPEGRYFVPLANDYRKVGDLERAEKLLREGIAKHPDYLSAHIVMGRCLADRGANEEAAEEFSYVLSMDPQNLIALRSLGEIATADGNPAEAERWYRELLAVDPMNEDARRAIAALESAAAEGAAPPMPEGEGPWDSEAATPAAAPEPAGAQPVRSDAAEDPTRFGELVDFELDAPAEAEEPATGSPAADAGAMAPQDEADEADWAIGGAADDLDDVGSVEVVTETIAELYARQGLHDRAAEVYRELIRRRGGDAHLEERLAELERAGSKSEPEGAAPAAEPSFDAADPQDAQKSLARDAAARETFDPEQDPQESEVPNLEPLDFEASEPTTEIAGEDSFAASFAKGFESGAGPSVPSGAGEDDADGWEPAPTIKPVLDIESNALEASGAPEPETDRAEQAEEEAEFVPSLLELDDLETEEPESEPLHEDATLTIGAYLASLSRWEPGQRSGAAARAGEQVSALASAEGTPEPEGLPTLSGAEQNEPAAPESAGSADDALPWEIPEPDLPDTDADQASILREDFSFAPDESAAAADEASPQAPAPEAAAPFMAEPESAPDPGIELDDYFSKTESASTGSETPAPADDEDDDLESFQAWLRSLKR
jgi:tetratricopeptide (TPR) repeat protein